MGGRQWQELSMFSISSGWFPVMISMRKNTFPVLTGSDFYAWFEGCKCTRTFSGQLVVDKWTSEQVSAISSQCASVGNWGPVAPSFLPPLNWPVGILPVKPTPLGLGSIAVAYVTSLWATSWLLQDYCIQKGPTKETSFEEPLSSPFQVNIKAKGKTGKLKRQIFYKVKTKLHENKKITDWDRGG